MDSWGEKSVSVSVQYISRQMKAARQISLDPK